MPVSLRRNLQSDQAERAARVTAGLEPKPVWAAGDAERTADPKFVAQDDGCRSGAHGGRIMTGQCGVRRIDR